MKNIVLTLAIVAAVIFLAACSGNKQDASVQGQQKALVLYYSQTGTTKAVAEEIQRLTGADIAEIEVTVPYDSDYDATIERVKMEREQGTLPTLRPIKANLSDYDVIYLGYPIWFGTYAPPIAALLKTESFEGKTIVPFCSFGSGGLEASVRDLKEALPQAQFLKGYGVRNARISAMPEELDRFLKESKLIEGGVEALPEFSEQQPVTEAERFIFDMACGDYQFPLGTPVSFGKRALKGNDTEYKFLVNAQSPDGQSVETTIYVIERLVEGDMVTAEFTKVVR